MLHNDGTWDPLPPRKLEQVAVSAPAPAAAKQVDTLDLADSDTEAEAGAADTEGAKVAAEEEEVVEDDGEDCVITLDRYKHISNTLPPSRRFFGFLLSKITFNDILVSDFLVTCHKHKNQQSPTNRYWEKFLSSDSEDEAVSAVTIALPLKKRARLDTGLREGSESPELICLDDDDD